MGAGEYKPPISPPQLMADFYTIGLVQSGTQNIPSVHQDQLDFELQQVETILIPHLREHLLLAAGYSICCELRHVGDEAKLTKAGKAVIKQHNDKTTYNDRYDLDRNGLLRTMIPPNLWDTYITYSTSGSGRPSREDTLKCFSGLDDMAKTIVKAQSLFATKSPKGQSDPLVTWGSGYGGYNWAQACQYWTNLYNASSVADMAIYIDRIYDLEHNSGALLDKNPEYRGNWLKTLLDIKFKANDPELLIRFCSPYMRKLSLMALKSNFGRGWDTGPLADAPMASNRMNPEFVENFMDEMVKNLYDNGFKCIIDKTARGFYGYVYNKSSKYLNANSAILRIDFGDGDLAVGYMPGTISFDQPDFTKHINFSVDDNQLMMKLIKLAQHSVSLDSSGNNINIYGLVTTILDGLHKLGRAPSELAPYFQDNTFTIVDGNREPHNGVADSIIIEYKGPNDTHPRTVMRFYPKDNGLEVSVWWITDTNDFQKKAVTGPNPKNVSAQCVQLTKSCLMWHVNKSKEK